MTPSPLSEMTKALERVEPVAWFMHLWNEADEDVKSDVRWGKPTSDDIERAEHNGHDVEYLYDRTLEDEVESLKRTRQHSREASAALHDAFMSEKRRAEAAEARVAELEAAREAVLAVVSATRAYLPPDGIDAQECLNRILAATDNAIINPIIEKAERGHVGA